MQTNIVLIGMPGAGKSTVGVLLAKTRGMAFLDTDLLLQKRGDGLLQDILEHQGIEQFLNLEEQVVLKLNCRQTVIATGGSVIYRRKAMHFLRQNGVVVYLNVSCGELEKRLDSISSRGVVRKKGQTLRDIYEERTPLYRRYAQITVDCSNQGVEETVEKVSEKVGKL